MRSTLRLHLAPVVALALFGMAVNVAAATPAQPGLVAAVPHAEGMRDLGRAGSNVRVQLAIVMNYRNEAQLEQLLDEQRDEGSPIQNHFLTSQQFRGYFAPTPSTYARTVAALQRAGFTVFQTFPNRTIIDVSAPAPTVNRYFQTEIHRVAMPGAGLHYANARPATLPAELRGAVFGVLGFDDIEWFRTNHVFAPRSALQTAGAIGNTVIGQPLKGPDGSYGPLAFAQGYDMPVQHQIPNQPAGTTYDGHGRTAGIVIPADPTDTDLSKFLTFFKVTRTGTTTRVKVDGGASNPSGGAEVEAALDYQTIAGVAPGANIDIFEFPQFTNQDTVDAYNKAVSDNIADTINSSFGACETSGFFTPSSFAQVFRQGQAQGQAFHESTGDDGTFTFGCSQSVSVQTPADIPATTAIGGTFLSVDGNGNYISEKFWNNQFGAGGGGVSTVFKAPKYQRHVVGLTRGGRNLPDLSFDADPASGEDIVFGGSFIGGGEGGTSLASPMFGGCMVEVEQVLGKRVAPLNKKLYSHWRMSGYASGSQTFAHDITAGTAFGILKPGPGYDLATGIGTLDCFVGGQKYL